MVFREGPPKITTPFKPTVRCANGNDTTTTTYNNNSNNVNIAPAIGNITRTYVGSNGETYSHHLVLDPNGKYHLFWRFDDTNITFEVQAQSRGWVGLGFSPNGDMYNADIVHMYIDNSGVPQLTVCDNKNTVTFLSF